MHKKLIIANWKANPATLKEAEELFLAVQRGMRGIKSVEVVLCPPFVYLSMVARLSPEVFGVGGQDCFWDQSGAYTGAVSPAMLKDIGCAYVIIGHSERRQYFGETNEIINKKLNTALKAGLKAILCIGEDTRDSFDGRGHWTHELDPRVKEQLVEGIRGVKKAHISNVIVAYEPVWAIGTGNPATPDDVFSAKIFIQKIISELYDRKTAESTAVLYGGSATYKNAASFVKEGRTDGLLVGGASLDADEFIAVVKSVSE